MLKLYFFRNLNFCNFCLPMTPSPFSGNRRACPLWEQLIPCLLNQGPHHPLLLWAHDPGWILAMIHAVIVPKCERVCETHSLGFPWLPEKKNLLLSIVFAKDHVSLDVERESNIEKLMPGARAPAHTSQVTESLNSLFIDWIPCYFWLGFCQNHEVLAYVNV